MRSRARLRAAKRELRELARVRRDVIPEAERERLGASVAARLFEVPGFAEAGTVMAFSSFGSEAPTGPILERLAEEVRRIALPRVVDGEIEARAYRPGDPVTRARFGALEPAGGELLPPEAVDAVVVPGLAFDRRGYRVGYGGGFYDRFLGRVRPDALTVGICLSVQLVDEVPAGRGDLPVAWVVTESESIRATGG